MNIEEVMRREDVDFSGIAPPQFLIGLLSAFSNRFQAMADREMKEISWKQCFALICLGLCKEPPSIGELAEIMGSSHQNVKQILLKLEKKGFVSITPDPCDRRKQRVETTGYCAEYWQKSGDSAAKIFETMFSGVSPEQLAVTIRTILQIENNMKNI